MNIGRKSTPLIAVGVGIGVVIFAPTMVKRTLIQCQLCVFRFIVNLHHVFFGSSRHTRPSIESQFLNSFSRKLVKDRMNETNPAVFRKELTRALSIAAPFPYHINIKKSMTTIPIGTGAESIPALWMNFPSIESKTPPVNVTIIYFHGGAFIEGDINSYKGAVAGVIHHLNQMNRIEGNKNVKYSVLIPEYRLAPEHPLPAAIEDCVATYRFVLNAMGESASNSILLMGDSAGGNLVISTALQCMKESLPNPAGLITFSPWVDLTLSGASVQRNKEKEAYLQPELLMKFSNWAAPTDELKRKYSPMFYAKDEFKGLSPLLVHVGSDEILLDDSVELSKLTDCEIEIYDGQIHDFNLFLNWLPEARLAIPKIHQFIINQLD